MTAEEKKDLLALLTDTHKATENMLEGMDLEVVIHPDSGWRVRDIIGHLATWDLQAAKSMRAYREGGEYAIPEVGNEDAFNQREFNRQEKLTTQQVLEEWEQGHEGIKEAVESLPDDKYPGDMLYPWGDQRGSVSLLIDFMCEHEVEHREEIITAIQGE